MKLWRFPMQILAVAVLSGCQRTPPPAPQATNSADFPSRAQPKLPTMKLWLGTQEMIAEIARTPAQRATGMMFRQEMGENEGMLFVFEQPDRVSFYMRNTVLPLSCAYIDPEGVILEIHDMKPLDLTSIESRSDQVQFVLETRQGWFERHQVVVGSAVSTERGSLAQVFLGRR